MMRLLFILYCIALVIASHWPRLRMAGQSDVLLGLDKWLHVLAFALLMLLAAAGRYASLPKTFIAILIYVPTNELTQQLVPGRTLDWFDIVASAIGVVLGLGMAWALRTDHSTLPKLSTNDADETETGPARDQPIAFVSHARLMSLLTLVSRFFGLGRDWALAFVLGFGWVLDAWVIAFMIPNLFRRLFGEGALAGAFVPHYAKLDQRQPTAARRFARFIGQLLLGGLGAIALLICLGMVGWYYLGPAVTERTDLTFLLTGITIWYAPLVCVLAVQCAVLQTHDRFGYPAAAPILLNIAIITAALLGLAIWGADGRTIALMLGLAVLAAGFVQLFGAKLQLIKAGVRLEDRPSTAALWRDEQVRSTSRSLLLQWGPTVLGLAVFQLNTLADSVIAMVYSSPAVGLMDAGVVAVLGAAARLYEFPLGVFGIAVATAIFPALSRAADDRADFGDLVRRGLRLTLFIGVPASVGLVMIRDLLTSVLYPSIGSIDAGDSQRIAWVLLGYAPAIWAYAANHILVRAFYAHHDAVTPMRISMAMVALNLIGNLTLPWVPLQPTDAGWQPLGAAGLAWSTALCAMIQTGVLLVCVRRFVDRPLDGSVIGGAARTLGLSMAMGVVVWLLLVTSTEKWMAWPARVTMLGAAVVIGGGVFLVGAKVLAMPERRWLLTRRAN